MNVKEVLQEARQLITPPGTWLIGLQRDGYGGHCALGAVAAARGEDYYYSGLCADSVANQAVMHLASLVDVSKLERDSCNSRGKAVADSPPYVIVANYNNTHTHKCVLEWFDTAIETAGDQ